jgi:hypothetical protein
MEILPLQHYLAYDFEHLLKKGDTIIWQHLWRFTWGSIYLKWAYDKNKFKLKQIIMDLKEPNQICSKFRSCRS